MIKNTPIILKESNMNKRRGHSKYIIHVILFCIICAILGTCSGQVYLHISEKEKTDNQNAVSIPLEKETLPYMVGGSTIQFPKMATIDLENQQIDFYLNNPSDSEALITVALYFKGKIIARTDGIESGKRITYLPLESGIDLSDFSIGKHQCTLAIQKYLDGKKDSYQETEVFLVIEDEETQNRKKLEEMLEPGSE